MPHFTNHVPNDPAKYAYTLERTPVDGALTAIVTSDDLLGCNTHYWGRHTVPCENSQEPGTHPTDANHCPACADLCPTRWHAYISCYDPKKGKHFLFECTAKAATAFEQYRDTYGSLRGCYFQAIRPKRRKNSGVVITTKPADLTKCNIPPGLDIPRAMAVIWQLPAAAVQTPSAEHSTPTVSLSPAVMDRMNGRAPSSNGKKKQ